MIGGGNLTGDAGSDFSTTRPVNAALDTAAALEEVAGCELREGVGWRAAC